MPHRSPVTSPPAETISAAASVSTSAPSAGPDTDRETLAFFRSPNTRFALALFAAPFLLGGVVKGVEIVKGNDQTQEIITKWTTLVASVR